jgi:hypothetical protein
MALLRGNVFQRVIETAAPAAGAESITTVPAGKYWRLIGFYTTLTTDATVATRLPSIVIDDGTDILMRINGSGTAGVTAGLTVAYTGYVGQQGLGITGVILTAAPLPSPDLVLEPGWRIRTLTQNIVAGDQWGIARLVVQEVEN